MMATVVLYATLTAMGQQAACEYIYHNYAVIGQQADVQKWIDDNAAFYAECVKNLRYTPKKGG